MLQLISIGLTLSALLACSSEDPSTKSSGGAAGAGGASAGASGGGGSGAGGKGGASSGGASGAAGSNSGGSAGSSAGGASGSGGAAGSSAGEAADWIETHFAGAEVITGNFTTRTNVETPALVKDATGCCAKYSFDVKETSSPDDRRAGFVNVDIKDLVSGDAFGGGIQTSGAPGVVLFLANVTIEPNWPNWESYSTTNKDGIVLDASDAIYAEDLTIKNWNADSAIDNKAPISQFVRLTIDGKGNRGIRYWGVGPHYLVDSQLTNQGGLGEGSVLWFKDCDGTTVNIYASTFNGQATVPQNLVSCDTGTAPKLVYLATDPRTTGEMHAMFSP